MKRLIVPLMAAVLGAWVMSAASAGVGAGMHHQGHQGEREDAKHHEAGDRADALHKELLNGRVAQLRADHTDTRDDNGHNEQQAEQGGANIRDRQEQFVKGHPVTAGGGTAQEALKVSKDALSVSKEAVRYSFWQVVVGAGTGFLLFLTLVSTNRAVQVANEANDTALEALRSTRELTQAQSRAYVTVKDVIRGCEDTENEGCKVFTNEIQVVFSNFGISPAENASFKIKYYVDDMVVPKNMMDIEPEGFEGGGVIFSPGVDVIGAVFPEEELIKLNESRIRNGGLALCVYGYVSYSDIYGKTHITKFRFVSGGRYWTTEGSFIQCPQGNTIT